MTLRNKPAKPLNACCRLKYLKGNHLPSLDKSANKVTPQNRIKVLKWHNHCRTCNSFVIY